MSEILRVAVRQALTPPPRLSISQWAERYRILSSESSASPGRWRNDMVPYLTGVMDAVKNPRTREITFKAAAQVGKTEFLLNTIGYYIHQEPSPQMVMVPILDLAEGWSKDRLAPMIRDTEVLAQAVEDPKARDSSNTILHKKYRGGHITLAGANSPASLSSRPVKIVIADEVDRMPDSAGAEGNPLDLAKKRTSTFYNRKFIATSSPAKDKKTSKIHLLYEGSKRHVYDVKCPHCKAFIPLEWDHVVWEKEDGSDAAYKCQECGELIKDGHKRPALKAGQWRCLDPEKSDIEVGYFISALYSPWVAFAEMVGEYLKSKNSPEKMKVWWNTYLGQPYEEETEGVAANIIYSRREPYAAQVPAGALVLVMGVDVQEDRLECNIIAFGHEWEAWAVDYRVLRGSPAGSSVWNDLDDVIAGDYRHEWGFSLRISATAVDSGHHTKAVYDYVKNKAGMRVYAVKGVAGTGRPIVGAPSRRKSVSDRRDLFLYPVGVDEAKSLVYGRLRIAEPGPSYFHFPLLEPFTLDYFRQLTAERLRLVYRGGYPTKVWELPKHRRNEVLDTAVYATAAAVILNPVFSSIEKRMAKMKDRKEAENAGFAVEDVKQQEAASRPAQSAKKNPFMIREETLGSFVNAWMED